MATGHPFPDITPSSRAYTPGVYPTKEFQGLNGAVTTLQYGRRWVDSKLEMTFNNISDAKADLILTNYMEANNGLDSDTGERDYVLLPDTQTGAMDGVSKGTLLKQMAERGSQASLRYRYATPPVITSTFPGRSTVQVELRGYLDGATSA